MSGVHYDFAWDILSTPYLGSINDYGVETMYSCIFLIMRSTVQLISYTSNFTFTQSTNSTILSGIFAMMMMIKSSNFKQKRKGQRFGCSIWLFFS